MSNLYPIWSAQDSIDTARQFHLELDNSERGHRVCRICDRSHLIVRIAEDGVCLNCDRRNRIGQFLYSRSRHRKARAMDAFAVACLMLVLAALGCAVLILATPKAKADPDPTYAYAAVMGGIACDVLDEHPSIAGVLGVAQGIEEDAGFTAEQAGRVIGYAVADICPRHMPLIRRFVAVYAPQEAHV